MVKPIAHLKSVLAGLVAAALVIAVPLLIAWWRVSQRFPARDSTMSDPYFHDTYFVAPRLKPPLFLWLLAVVVFARAFYWEFRRERFRG
jgi:hypothetical protein